MAEAVVLIEVEWYAIENPENYGGYPYYRSCDICFDTAVEDAHAGKRIEEFRRFWQEFPSHLTICENCLESFLLEKTNGHESEVGDADA